MKLKKARSSFKLVLITESRDDLCTLTTSLFSAIPVPLFEDRKAPVIVTVRGGYNSGKSIFPDVFRDSFISGVTCTSKAVYDGDRLDESYQGLYQGKPFEHGFINSSYLTFSGTLFSHPAVNEASWKNGERGIVFSNLRQHGGIAFVHNDDDAVMESSIDIWIEDSADETGCSAEGSRLKTTKDQSIKSLFENATGATPWRRYLEISVFDHRLFENEAFMKAVGQLGGLKRIECTTQAYPKPPQKQLTPTRR